MYPYSDHAKFDFHARVVTGFFISIVLFLGSVVFTADAQRVAPAKRSLANGLAIYLRKGTTRDLLSDARISVYVAELGSGKAVFSLDSKRLATPASVQKLFTTYAALKLLGSEYRFPTEVFVDRPPAEVERGGGVLSVEKKTSGTGRLYVRGYGDPSMVEETLWVLANEIKARGVSAVSGIYLDDTLFLDPPRAKGPEPYQAALGAISLNNNCYGVTVSPGPPGGLAFVSLTPGSGYRLSNLIVTRRGHARGLKVLQVPSSAAYGRSVEKRLGHGAEEVSFSPRLEITARGAIGNMDEARVRYFTEPDPTLYFGGVLKHLMTLLGVSVGGEAIVGEIPEDAKALYVHKSKELRYILSDMNHYSNNFIAGQILYAIGQDKKGYFRMDLGIRRVLELLRRLGIAGDGFRMVDASGLSRENAVNAETVVRLLVEAYRDASIAPDFTASLSRFGYSGTLSKRRLLPNEGTPFDSSSSKSVRARGVWAKTGTLDSVSSLAGYVEGKNAKRYAFAVVIEGELPKSRAVRVEDGVVRVILGIER